MEDNGLPVMKYEKVNTLSMAEKASQWLYLLDEDDSTECRSEFLNWLRQSPNHIQEFLMVTAVSQELDGFKPDKRIDIEELIAEAKSYPTVLNFSTAQSSELRSTVFGNEENAGDFHDSTTMPAHKPSRTCSNNIRKLRRQYFLIAAVFVLLSGLFLGWLLTSWQIYSTSIGEQRSVKLEDGSTMYLNTSSRMLVHFTKQSRNLWLLHGEALLQVAPEHNRPFQVSTHDAVAYAVGTEFNVLDRGEGTIVSVVEGVVQVAPRPVLTETIAFNRSASETDTVDANRSQKEVVPIKLGANEEAKITKKQSRITKHTIQDIDETLAWRERRLVFRDEPLSNIVREFNRYNPTPQFHIVDDELGMIRYTGIVNVDEPRMLKKLLTLDENLILEQRGDEILIGKRIINAQ